MFKPPVTFEHKLKEIKKTFGIHNNSNHSNNHSTDNAT